MIGARADETYRSSSIYRMQLEDATGERMNHQSNFQPLFYIFVKFKNKKKTAECEGSF